LPRQKECETGSNVVFDARFEKTDGLNGFAPEKHDAVAICGMGGRTIAGILERAREIACPVVLQPNTEQEALRASLMRQGYAIADEELVLESGRFYTLMRIARGYVSMDKAQLYIGPVAFCKKDRLCLGNICVGRYACLKRRFLAQRMMRRTAVPLNTNCG
jgi:tRNA A22 N-methylase